MVQAIDRLVVPRAAVALASVVMLAGCQCFGLCTQAEAGGQDAISDAEVAAVCPVVTKSEAWVNRMPTIGDAPTKMTVMLGVNGKDTWFLTPLDMPAAQGLILDLKPGGATVPGTVAYRQTAPAPLPARIVILCQGSEIAAIERVTIVQ
ncbi:hypothetical protein [Hyphomonas sp.]|uniref:hypothetical protein n=1 Tax=Hyphomonas sp. TaxID=87 RepID=UPI003528B5D3